MNSIRSPARSMSIECSVRTGLFAWHSAARNAEKSLNFVKEIASDARKSKRNAAIAVQNAEELLTDNDYVDTIDAVGKEDLYHGINHDGSRNNKGAVKASVDLLKKAKARGKGVYVVEYLNGDGAKRVRNEASRDGFVASTGKRKLDTATED